MAMNCIQDLGEDVTRKGLYCTWIDERDWKTVCSQLYSSRAAERQRGVARVSAWRARGVVPFPVEITADIIDSQLLDEQQQSTLLTEQTLALLYSMVVTRFINGVTDYGFYRGRRNQSILKTVSHYGVPSWLVTMRHEGTHKVLPSLSTLRQGAKFAYRWLWTNYWEPQYHELAVIPPPVVQPAQQHQKSISPSSSPSKNNATTDPAALNWLRKELRQFTMSDVSQPSVRKLLNLKSTAKRLANTDSSSLSMLLIEGLLLSAVEDSTAPPMPVELKLFPPLSPAVLQRWKKLLRPMGRHLRTAKTNLLHALISTVHNSHITPDQTNLLAGWVGELLGSCHPRKETVTDEKQEDTVICIDILEESPLMAGDVQWWSLFEAAKHNIGIYTYAIMNEVLQQISSTAPSQLIPNIDKLTHLAALVTVSERIGYKSLPPHCLRPPITEGQYHEELTTLKEKVEEVNKKKMREKKAESLCMDEVMGKEKEEEEERSDWRRVEGPWLNCPLGLLPGEPLTPFSLDLPSELDAGHKYLADSYVSNDAPGNPFPCRTSTPVSAECEKRVEKEKEETDKENDRMDAAELQHAQLIQYIQEAVTLL